MNNRIEKGHITIKGKEYFVFDCRDKIEMFEFLKIVIMVCDKYKSSYN